MSSPSPSSDGWSEPGVRPWALRTWSEKLHIPRPHLQRSARVPLPVGPRTRFSPSHRQRARVAPSSNTDRTSPPAVRHAEILNQTVFSCVVPSWALQRRFVAIAERGHRRPILHKLHLRISAQIGRVGSQRVTIFWHFSNFPPPNRACGFHRTRLSSQLPTLCPSYCPVCMRV